MNKKIDSDILSDIGLYIKTKAHGINDDSIRGMLFTYSRLMYDLADVCNNVVSKLSKEDQV